mgnify:CR=1 FL=1
MGVILGIDAYIYWYRCTYYNSKEFNNDEK